MAPDVGQGGPAVTLRATHLRHRPEGAVATDRSGLPAPPSAPVLPGPGCAKSAEGAGRSWLDGAPPTFVLRFPRKAPPVQRGSGRVLERLCPTGTTGRQTVTEGPAPGHKPGRCRTCRPGERPPGPASGRRCPCAPRVLIRSRPEASPRSRCGRGRRRAVGGASCPGATCATGATRSRRDWDDVSRFLRVIPSALAPLRMCPEPIRWSAGGFT